MDDINWKQKPDAETDAFEKLIKSMTTKKSLVVAQKRQDKLNRWLIRMARSPDCSVVSVELQRRKEQYKINKLKRG